MEFFLNELFTIEELWYAANVDNVRPSSHQWGGFNKNQKQLKVSSAVFGAMGWATSGSGMCCTFSDTSPRDKTAFNHFSLEMTIMFFLLLRSPWWFSSPLWIGVAVTALSGVTLCAPPQLPRPHSQSHWRTHRSLLAPTGPLESWRRRFWLICTQTFLPADDLCLMLLQLLKHNCRVTHVTIVHLLHWFTLLIIFNGKCSLTAGPILRTWFPPSLNVTKS